MIFIKNQMKKELPTQDQNFTAFVKDIKTKILSSQYEALKAVNDDLSKLIGVSAEAIKQHLSNLKKEGKLKRVGSTKLGYWKVINE